MTKATSRIFGTALVIGLAALSLVAGTSAQAVTYEVATSTIAIAAHGAELPEMTVSLGVSAGPGETVTGATLPVPDNWTKNPAFIATDIVWNAPGDCGIQGVTAGTTSPYVFAPGSFSCTYGTHDVAHSSWRIIVSPTSGSIIESAPLNITLSAGALTAPTTGASSTWSPIILRDDGGSGIAAIYQLRFDLTDLSITPEVQSISCEQGVPMESTPLTTTGFPSVDQYGEPVVVQFTFLEDPPIGVTIDPTTGVVSGTPLEPVLSQAISITATASQLAGNATTTLTLLTPEDMAKRLAATGAPSPSPVLPILGFLFLGLGLLVVSQQFRSRRDS